LNNSDRSDATTGWPVVTDDAPADVLRTRLRTDLRAAMKAQARDEMAALRSLIAAIDNAESVEDSSPPPRTSSEHVAGAVQGLGAADGTRRTLSERDLQRIIEAELWERDAQAERLDLLGRVGDASHLRVEADVIARYQIPVD
jgi:uncharacterized protein YqeY